MINNAFYLMFAVAASQQQVRECLPNDYTHTVLENKLDRVVISENERHIIEAHNGTSPELNDWYENFKIKPNEDGLHTGFVELLDPFIRALIDQEKPSNKIATECGHSQGSGKAFVSAYLKYKYARMRSGGPFGYGGSMWAIDELVVPNGTRTVCGDDPVAMESKWLRVFPFFRRVKRIPATRIQGCPGGKCIALLDHDYLPYLHGMALECKRQNDAEGAKKMCEIMEVVNQQWRRLEGL